VPTDVQIWGGATIPTRFMPLSASRPLAELTADYKGVAISLGSRKLTWRVSWAELDHVLVGPRSVVLVPVQGRACRFNVRSRPRLEPLLAMFDSQHIPSERVRSTIGWVFKI
jgi:hypothetical protein